MIYEGNICQITHGGLDEALFRVHPVWCECYIPSEIALLERCGESRLFLEIHLIDRAKAFDANKTYYSWPLQETDAFTEGLPEFVHVGAKFHFLEKNLFGFLWLVGGGLRGITVFHDDGESDFSLNDDMREDNALELNTLAGEPTESPIQIKITVSENVSRLVDYAYAQIPV